MKCMETSKENLNNDTKALRVKHAHLNQVSLGLYGITLCTLQLVALERASSCHLSKIKNIRKLPTLSSKSGHGLL